MRTEIIYEDRDILVVQKPAGLAVQTARTGEKDVVSELKNYLPQPYLGIVHRLDQPVEGLLVFAKNRAAAAGLTAQLQNRGEGSALHKSYRAVLCGKPSVIEDRLVDYLYKNDQNKALAAETADETERFKAKRGVLSYRILQTLDDPAELSLAEITLETGRFHQIRAQMAHHGWPLLGDAKYGDEKSVNLAQRLSVRNVALCARRLEFEHPVSGKSMNFVVEPRSSAFSFFSQI